MATITERFVQEAVYQQLNKKYYHRKPVYAGMESYTGLKRADVLLSFMRAANRPYVVVVECKSRSTIGQLKLKTDKEGSLWAGRLVAALLLIGLGGMLGWNWYFNALNTSLLLGAFVGLVTVIGGFLGRLELFFLKSVKAIEQLAAYPANESWIAISSDTFVNRKDYRALHRQCRKNRVGLIVVDRRGRLRLKLKPRAVHVFNNYLARYGKKREILTKIDRGRGYGPTPAERAKRIRQSVVGLGGLLLVGGIGGLGYEQSYGPTLDDPLGVEIDLWAEESERDTLSDTTVTMAAQSCESLVLFSGKNFLLADKLCRSEACARSRTIALRSAGFEGALYISSDCYSSSLQAGQYLVYNGLFDNRADTQRAAQRMREQLQEAGLPVVYDRPLRVRERN